MSLKTAESVNVLNNNFFIESQLERRELPAALNAATISTALFLDISEMRANSANKFFDALAAEKPIMINYGGWMYDLVQTHGCGLAMWRVPLKEVAIELNAKIHDIEWLDQASKASSSLADNQFDRNILANQLLKVIECTYQGRPNEAEAIAPGIY